MKSCTGAEPVSLMEASAMVGGFVWLWASKSGFGGFIVGLSAGFDAIASAKVIFFCFDFAGEHCSSSFPAASSSDPPCIISDRWELIDGSALSSSIWVGGDTTVDSATFVACSLRCLSSDFFCSSSSCFLSASRAFFSSSLLSFPFSICILSAASAAFFLLCRCAFSVCLRVDMVGFLFLRVGGGFFHRLFRTMSFEKNLCVIDIECPSLLADGMASE